MTKPTILIMGPVFEPVLKDLESAYDCHRLWQAPDAGAMFASVADRCEIVVTNGGRGIKAAEMAQLPNLKLISCFGVGVDAIDVPYAHAHGITVTNTPDVLTEDVADMAFALTISAVRQIPVGDRHVRAGRWAKGGIGLTRSMNGRKVGIVGLGRIGQAIASRCLAFGTTIAYQGPRRKPDQPYEYFESVVELARWADILIAACPGGPATNKIVSRAALEALGPDGIFVNIARGSVVDQDALVELLESGKLGGAGLDVFNDEPHAPAALFALDHVVLQPHQGSATHPTRNAMGKLTVDNVHAYVQGKALLTPV